VTREEIGEVMITAALYCGFPRAIDGMLQARKPFAERDAAGGTPYQETHRIRPKSRRGFRGPGGSSSLRRDVVTKGMGARALRV
jgi:hypothetical protein